MTQWIAKDALTDSPARAPHFSEDDPVEQTPEGSYVVNAEEMHVLRQALFVTLHHGDSVFRGNEQPSPGTSSMSSSN